MRHGEPSARGAAAGTPLCAATKGGYRDRQSQRPCTLCTASPRLLDMGAGGGAEACWRAGWGAGDAAGRARGGVAARGAGPVAKPSGDVSNRVPRWRWSCREWLGHRWVVGGHADAVRHMQAHIHHQYVRSDKVLSRAHQSESAAFCFR